MASELGLPPPAKGPPTAPTAITDIGDDLLREIFLRHPSLPSLVCAALACRTFLHAVQSSPASRRRFQALHPPQILGFFPKPCHPSIPPFWPLRSRSDPDLAAAIRGADFLLTRIPEDSTGRHSTRWDMQSCHAGYVVLVNLAGDQAAAYNPVTQALDIFPLPPPEPEEIDLPRSMELHIVVSEEDDPGAFRVLCVKHPNTSQQGPACTAVFSSATRECKVLPSVETAMPSQLEHDEDEDDMLVYYSGTQLNELLYWKNMSGTYVTILDTATLQFSRVDLPSFRGEIYAMLYALGQTKDGKLFIAVADYDFDANVGKLVVWFWRADDDGVEKWMLGDTYPLGTFVDATPEVEGVIDGFVYLCNWYEEDTRSLLSLCLETGKLNKLFDDTYETPAHPYIMAWPPSLVHNKASPC